MRVKYHDNPLLQLNSGRMNQVASTGFCLAFDALLWPMKDFAIFGCSREIMMKIK
jgi:hypothetical protein